tara:strand:- start:374 stop:1519 length:1146 start_codon:yes stop_codon:yes gene_type:complete
MGRFWKEVVGGQVNTGVYQAGPRHASKQYGSFKTGRPPRLPFQFVTYFEVNPEIKAFLDYRGTYDYSSLVRAIDLPSVQFTVDKKNQYNKLKPIITTKDFKPFSLTVYDDIESRWYALWQNFYNFHFMDGRFDQSPTADAFTEKGKDEEGNEIDIKIPAKGNELANRNVNTNRGLDLIADTYEVGSENSPFNSDLNGLDIHAMKNKNFFDAIHVFQIHSTTVTRTTAINPVLTDAQVTQLDYSSSGVPSEITFNIEYEKLAYGPILNYEYEEDDILKDLLEDVTKAPVFDPSPDKLKGIVRGLFGLEQRNVTRQQIQLHDEGRDVQDNESFNTSILRDGTGTTEGGFFSNLIGNAINKKLDEATSDLFKKNNKNINKLNFL